MAKGVRLRSIRNSTCLPVKKENKVLLEIKLNTFLNMFFFPSHLFAKSAIRSASVAYFDAGAGESMQV